MAYIYDHTIFVVVTLLLKSTLLLAATGDEDAKEEIMGPKCIMEDGKSGICVPNYLCNFETNSIDPGASIDLRSFSCADYRHICCLQQELQFRTEKDESDKNEDPPQCGWSNPGATDVRIQELVGTAMYGEFPWMVALLKSNAPEKTWSQDDYLGGGSIIHPKVVLTAAHKVDGFYENDIKCRAGEWDISNDDETYPSQDRQVQKIITHEDFFRVQVYYNIALLVLKDAFTFNKAAHMGIACMGKTLPEPGTQCYTMGWGKESTGNYASILKKIQLPLIDSDECEHSLRNTRLGSRFLLHPSLMCAGGLAGVDTCKGDGGSSLVCKIGDVSKGSRYAVFGMVSSGVGCGKKNVPGVYVNTPYLYSWVEEKMKEEKLDPKTFTY